MDQDLSIWRIPAYNESRIWPRGKELKRTAESKLREHGHLKTFLSSIFFLKMVRRLYWSRSHIWISLLLLSYSDVLFGGAGALKNH